MKKTIKVNDIIDKANILLLSENLSRDEKSGICYLLEGILHQTSNYNGFIFNKNVKPFTETNECIGVNHPQNFERQYFKK